MKLEKILTYFLLFLLILCIIGTIYLIYAPKIGERFTEFYILNKDLKAYDYPTDLLINESAMVFIGVSNHEYKDMNYTILAFLSDKVYDYNYTVNITILNKWNETLSYKYALSKKVYLRNNETILIPLNFSISIPGRHKIEFILLKDDERKVYRELHLWVNVKEKEELI
ncbi:DUF1616 domain-containing protein [Methanotorris igneus]|nr:DUF1616 domain-containing protein [Methanotorris igneus]